MHPGDDHDGVHLPDEVRTRDQERIEFLWIELFLPEQSLAEPCADHVHDYQCGDAEAERELQRLDRFPAELPALIQRPETQAAVKQHRRVQGNRNRKKLPEQGVVIDADGQRIHRDVAERMIEEMADQIAEQHHAADEPDLAYADAAEECSDVFAQKDGHAIHGSSIGYGRI